MDTPIVTASCNRDKPTGKIHIHKNSGKNKQDIDNRSTSKRKK